MGAPNLREVNCQVKSSSDIFISVLCQLNKLESVQWNWSPSSWVHSALLAVRLHLAVNSDSSWAVRHISLADIHTQKNVMSLCFSSVLPFIFLSCLSPIVTVCLCRPCMIYNELYKATTSRPCLYKATLSTDNTAFHSLEEREFCTLLSFWRSGGRAVARGGFLITWVLCTGLWDDVLSVFDDCY